MSRVWTKQQCAVLDGEGQMVVSASAGSGKTAVMIEKIKNLIVKGVKVEEILAVTFTRASAQEMKERLQKALKEELLKTQDEKLSEHLKTELDEIESATITTIDSFCNALVKKHFFRLEGVVPNFTILTKEDYWLQKLQKRAMHLAMQDWLSMRKRKRSIDNFCKIFAKNATFEQIHELVLQGYDKVRNRADYLAFMESMPQFYTESTFESLLAENLNICKNRLKELEQHCQQIYENFCAWKSYLSDKFYAYIVEISNFCKAGANCQSYAKLVEFTRNYTIPTRPMYRASKNTEEAVVIAIKKDIEVLRVTVSAIKDLKEEILYYQDRERAYKNFIESGRLTAAFCKLVLLFDSYLRAEKIAAGKLEFIDLAHLVNQLLQEPEVQLELQEQYRYLFVDEYQDTSPIQESILQKLNIKNFCMVGDLKQSIYGFRGCTPEIMQKKMEDRENYTLYQLSQNFRSRRSIIEFVNTVFENILPYYDGMQSDIDPECTSAIYTYSYLPKEVEVQSCNKVYSVLDNLEPTVEVTPEAELAYAIITDYIARMGAEKGIPPQECYKDIVLLTRSRNSNIEKVIAYLVEKGVPITTDAVVNICNYPEIKALCNILEFIHNRQQDIPLVATLKSAIIGMTDEELITIKQGTEGKTFYQACMQYAKEKTDAIAEKCRAADRLSKKLQTMAKLKSCSEVLEYLLIEEELELSFLASGGKNSAKYATNRQKLMRIERLLEASADCSVSEFLFKLQLQGGKIFYKPSGGENAVQIMTVHQSKGLEFPVVVLVGLENKLAHNEKVDKFKYDSNYGFYFDAYNTENFTKEKTILSRLAREWQVQKAIEDQKRIFYVAMTRAKQELHIVLKRKENKLNLYKEYAQFSDFLEDLNIEGYDRTAELIVARGADFAQVEESEQGQRVLPLKMLTEETLLELGKNYQQSYPYAEACRLPIKSSATALKVNFAVDLEERREKRLFPSGENVLTGLAYHAFLEHINLNVDTKDRGREVDRVYQMLSAEYQSVLNKEKMMQILQLPIFEKLKTATIYKEKAFLLQAKANEIEILQSNIEDEILLQGIIDLLAIEGDRITIVDYKYSSQSMTQLRREYHHQMQIYKLAVEKWQRTKQIECYLFNIKSGECMQVEV